MNRRGFLRILAGAGAAATTSYFFAPKGGWGIVQPTDEELTKYVFTGRNVQLYGGGQFHGIHYNVVPSTSGQYLGVYREQWIAAPRVPKEPIRFHRLVREMCELLSGDRA